MKLIDKSGTRSAPAKVNVRLEILGTRTDGYHEIRSIMCPVGLFDDVTVSPAIEGIAITVNGDILPLDSRNLAYQAAALFAERATLANGVAIHLEKRIPVGAGLGGGSSDAAAVLSLLNELAEAGYSRDDLMDMGASLGSDVPFFCGSGPALATGRGEQIAPIRLSPSFWAVLVMPSFSVSTAWAYSAYCHSEKESTFAFGEEVDLLAQGRELLRNDLEEAVGERFSEIGEIKEALGGCGAWGSLMSGSGSTVFGIFLKERQAREAQRRIQADCGERRWKVAVVPALV